ncbi:MAG TPA: protein kinase [Caulobacteraceae bacterium]|nr:protein kinase [Caulobacteraceae bacterium]
MPHLGRYEIQARIGQGAMANVYRAHDPSIGRILAIKVLKPEYRRSQQYTARFLREAKAAGALSHPNIVTIYDVGDVDGHAYIAMELLPGSALDAVLGPGAMLAPSVVVDIGLQLAEALRYAHQLGVVHRDIKPSNIMLAPDGRSVKILDFGIARMNEAEGPDGDEGLKTQIGQVIGTPRYMSPEQAYGRPIDGRSDLFSAGVVLYELICGRKAFGGASPASLALQITREDPRPLSEFAPQCPKGLQFIVQKLLAKDPDRRFSDGEALAEALRRERKFLDARSGEGREGRRHLPLQIRLALLMTLATAMVLAASTGAVLNAEVGTMRKMALTSGAAITSFVANNAALQAAENAALPPPSRDWLPVQAFVKAASRDASVRRMTVADTEGVIRASSDSRMIGTRQPGAAKASIIERTANMVVSELPARGGTTDFRFSSPIRYAGRSFGLVAVDLSEAQLAAAARQVQELLIALAAVTLGVVLGSSYLAARLLALPIRRLKGALRDASRGNLDFRISHHRRDEFGELFDEFNRLANAVAQRVEDRDAAAAWPRDPTAGNPSHGRGEAEATRVASASHEPRPADPAIETGESRPAATLWRGRWARAVAARPPLMAGRA